MKKKIWFVLLFLLAFFFVKLDFSQAQEQEAILDRPLGIERLANGHTLIADGGGQDWTNQGSEIIEIDSEGKVVWSFQDRLIFAHGVKELSNGNLLIIDTTNNRLIEISRDKEIVWSSESWPKSSVGRPLLNLPTDVEELENGHFLVTDRNNDRVIEIDRFARIYWQKRELNRPHDADRLAGGNTLISDSENDQVLELNQAGQVVWSYGGGDKNLLYSPRDADKLENGNYLITDNHHHRVIEVTPENEVIWQYEEFLSFPYEADRLANGNTLISDSSHARVIEVSPDKKIVWQFRNAPKPKYSDKLNGGFESDENKDDWPDNWVRGNLLAEGSGTFGWDENIFKDGHHSAQIGYDGTGIIFWRQYYPVKPGQKYDLIGLIKSQNLVGAARFEVIFVDELGGQIGIAVQTPDHKGTTLWKRYETIFTPPPKTVAADIRCLVEGKGTAWFDEISLMPVGWERILGVKLSLALILGGIIIALLLNKLVK